MSPWDRAVSVLSRWRWVALALAAVVTALSAAWARHIPFVSGVADYLPDEVPQVRTWLEMSRRFDAFNALLVGLDEPGRQGMSIDGLSHVQQVTHALEQLKASGVLAASSITNVESMHEGADGAVDTDKLVPAIPTDQAGLEDLEKRVRDDREVLAALVSRDLRGYAVLVRADPRKDSADVARVVRNTVEKERGTLRASYFGAPFFTAAILDRLSSQAHWIAPAFVLLLLTVLAVGVRAPGPILVVLGSTALALVWWLGLMHALGLALSQSSGNVAFVLLALAFSAYGGSFATRAAPDVPATRPFPGRTAAALVAIAFASVSLAKVKTLYIAHFGAVLAPGVLAILGSGALVFVPLASLLPPVAERKGTQRAYAPAVGVVLALLVLAIGGVVAKRGRFLITPQEMFSPQEQVGETLAFFDNRFGGTDFIQIDFKGDLRDPSVAARLLRLTDLLDGSRAFSDVRSVAQILGFLSHGFGGDFRIPSSRDSLANIWFFLEGNPDVKNLVSDKRDEAMVMVRIPSRPSSTMEVLESKVQAAIDGSARTDPAAAVERLAGLARSFSLEFPRDRIDAVVNAAARPLDAGDALQVNGRVSAHLREYLASPDSPYKPSDEEWGQFAAALARESDARQHVVEVAHSIGALTAKNIADAFVDTVLERDKALRLSARAEVLAERLWQGQANVPDSFKVRAQGAIADLLDPPANGGPAATITVSGFPVVAGAIETDLKRGLGLAVGLVLALGALVLLALTMNPSAVARTLLVAMSAAALTLIGCRLAGVLVDSGSATLYLGPAFVGLLSGGRTAGQHRSAVIFLLALAAGGVTLVFSGTMPVARVGAALTISVASVGLTSHLSRWFRNGVAT